MVTSIRRRVTIAQYYDLIIIGAGPGGYVAAIKAAQLGKKVALIEKGEVGGVCLNRGCIPTKTLNHTAELLLELKIAADIGLDVGNIGVDMARLWQRKDDVVAKLRSGVESLLQANAVELIRGHGCIGAEGRVSVGTDTYAAEKILIATGSRPLRPPILGIDLPGVVTADELLSSAGALCRRMVIIGGGVIGVEFAGIYQALGCQVTIVELQARILSTLDREISQSLSMSLKKRGVNILTATSLGQISHGDDELICLVQGSGGEPQEIAVDMVLIATGRQANTEGLLGDGIDLQLEQSRIPVDERFQTVIPGIYAIGDVIKGSVQLAHAASAQGINAVCGMFGVVPPYDLNAIPSCIYSTPEIAMVGISEAEAKAQGVAVKIGKYLTAGNAKSVITQWERGFIKLIFAADSERLLGAQLLCPRATDMVGGLAQAIISGLTRSQLAATVLPHPTFVEAIGEAVEDAAGEAIHAMPKRR